MEGREIVIPKVWRSELPRLVLFLVFSVASVFFSRLLPASVVKGELLHLFGWQIIISVPLFWFIPAYVLMSAMYRIYNVRYSVDTRGIEAKVGILSLNQSITRIRFEDIRSIETEQTLLERMLDVGLVEMGTAASAGLEMIFRGVASPKHVQEMIQHERDKRIRQAHAANASEHNESKVIGNE